MSIRYRVKLRKGRARVDGDGVFVASTPEECEQVLRMIDKPAQVGVDCEGYGADPRVQHWKDHFRIVSMQFSTPDVPHIFVKNYGKSEGNIRIFKKWLARERPQKVLSNANSDMHMIANHGMELRGLYGDTQVMSWVYFNDRAHGLKSIVHQDLGVPEDECPDYAEVFAEPVMKKDGTPGKRMVVPPLNELLARGNPEDEEKLIAYGVKDPWFSVRECAFLEDKLRKMEWSKKGSMWDYFQKFELPFITVLHKVERRGNKIDQEKLEEIAKRAKKAYEKAERAFFKECVRAGVSPRLLENFNVGSGPQLGNLFERVLRSKYLMRTKTGRVAVDEEALMYMALYDERLRAVATALLRVREVGKTINTYTDGFLRLAPQYGWYLHTWLKHTGTIYGRTTSSAPNLQNIPVPQEDEAGDGDEFRIRSVFVAPKGMHVGDADYSAADLRFSAIRSQDPTLLKVLREGIYVHAVTAARINPTVRKFVGTKTMTVELSKEIKKKYPGECKLGKNYIYGASYGMGAKGAVRQIFVKNKTVVTEAQTRADLERFWAGYPTWKRYIEASKDRAQARGYTLSLLRRRIHQDMTTPENMPIRKRQQVMGAIRHKWFTYEIAGCTGDLKKCGMLACDADERLKKWGIEMDLEIHDEIKFRVPNELRGSPEVKEYIEDLMGRAPQIMGMGEFILPTPAEYGEGDDWAEAK